MSRQWEQRILFLLLLVVAVLLIWLASVLPVHIDEALTHRHFASQGWKIAISTYPFPNNHVFFSLLASLAVKLPFDPLFMMRLISVLAGVANTFLVYRILRFETDATTALMGAAFWTATLAGIYYGVHARGYGIQLTCLLVGMFCILRWKRAKADQRSIRTSRNWAVFIIASALGFFTIPTFLFPFASLILWILISESSNQAWKQRMRLVMWLTAITATVTVMLYLPLLYYSGIGLLINNQWVAERRFSVLGTAGIWPFLTDVSAYAGYLTVVLMLFVAAYLHRKARHLNMLLLFLACPVVIMLVMRSIPFPRTFAYLSAIFVIFLFSNLDLLAQKRRTALVYVMLLITGTFVAGITYKSVSGSFAKESARAKEIQVQLQQILPPGEVIYVDGWNECAHLIDYYSWRKGAGPSVKFIYEDDFWKAFREAGGRYYFEDDTDAPPPACSTAFAEGRIQVFECNWSGIAIFAPH